MGRSTGLEPGTQILPQPLPLTSRRALAKSSHHNPSHSLSILFVYSTRSFFKKLLFPTTCWKCLRLLGSNYIYEHTGIPVSYVYIKSNNQFYRKLSVLNQYIFQLVYKRNSLWDYGESCIFTYCKPIGKKAEETPSYIFIKYIYVC